MLKASLPEMAVVFEFNSLGLTPATDRWRKKKSDFLGLACFFVELQMLANHPEMIMYLCLHLFPATSFSFFL